MKKWAIASGLIGVFIIFFVSLWKVLPRPVTHESTEQAQQTTTVSKPSKEDEPTPWIYGKSEDALHGKSSDVFVLDGRYLSTPSTHGMPRLVALCSKGKPEQLRLDTGIALRVDSVLAFPVEKRLDGKFSRTSWSVYDSHEDLSIPRRDFQQILAGRHLIVGVDTIWASQAVMQFDMPNSEQLIRVCGLKP
jgi:hypothetical protein